LLPIGNNSLITLPGSLARLMSEAPIKEFGVVIKNLRQQRQLSQEALGFATTLDRAFISQLENGHKQPTLLTIFRLAAALGVSVSELMSQVESRLAEDSQ
jgi:transcriptional regulator with XRE-family HTH domain